MNSARPSSPLVLIGPPIGIGTGGVGMVPSTIAGAVATLMLRTE